MKKEKKQYSVFTVLLCIMFLAVFIILPPICRKFFPEPEKEVEQVKSTMYTLDCSRNSASEKMKIRKVVEYKNTEILSHTLNFELFEPTPEDIENEKQIPPLAYRAIDEINFLKSLHGINAKQDDKTATFVLTIDILNNNDPQELNKYFSTRGEIKKQLESEGYTCKLK